LLHQGKIVRWHDDRGFGFVRTDDAGDIFLHVSALGTIERRPRSGDEVIFEIEQGADGRRQAINAVIIGVLSLEPIQYGSARADNKINRNTPPTNRSYSITRGTQPHKAKSLGRFAPILIVTLVVLANGPILRLVRAWLHPFAPPPNVSSTAEAITPDSTESNLFSCSGKTHCSEMTSCEEAIYYLENCPFPQMDGDGDGIPCERQWCN